MSAVEKAPASPVQPHQALLRPRPCKRGRSGLAVILAICLAITITRPYWDALPALLSSPNDDDTVLPTEFDWNTAASKRHLEYSDCFRSVGNFQCARLELPMDYFNGTTQSTISLAVIRKPASVPITDPRYGGAVIVNPGGPGGSGVMFVLLAGSEVSDVIDSPDGKVYDVLSFDPRGVGSSTPAVNCFEDPVAAQSWQLRVSDQGLLGVSDASLGRLWAMSNASGSSCNRPLADGRPDIKKYVTTASVAKDVLSLVDAHGEWREKEAKRILQSSSSSSAMQGAVMDGLKYTAGKEVLQYWGFSYGTHLGLTFAAMFPNRVRRLVLDGVVDPVDYSGGLWYDNLVDTEKDMHTFYSNCARVGFPRCPLASQTGNSTVYVKRRVQNILKSLYHNPLPVLGEVPDVITFSDVKNFIFRVLYTPMATFPLMAQLLADIERGNGTAFANLLTFSHNVQCGLPKGVVPSFDTTRAIACSDGDDLTATTKDEFGKFLEKIERLSSTIGARWAEVHMACVHWPSRPHHRFVGPWSGNTSHPVLFVGNTADPVTPGRNAVNQAKSFEGAVALIQNSPGHCSSAAYSKCTTNYIRSYFQTGELPPENTTCEVDELPFGPSSEDGESAFDLMDATLRDKARAINKAMYEAGGGFLGHSLAKHVNIGIDR